MGVPVANGGWNRPTGSCWRTNLTMHQLGPLFGVSHAAAHRIIDTLGSLLAPVPV